METLGNSQLKTFLQEGWQEDDVTNSIIRNDPGTTVSTFPQLVRNVAQLSYYNRDQVLLFRGQRQDFTNVSGKTTIQPQIFRPRPAGESRAWSYILGLRYNRLKRAERLLVRQWGENELPDFDRIQRHQSLRWAILQHYEICPTPLLDVTHSLRVAASFAADNNHNDSAILYIIAVPQISGAITASAEAGLQILRLSSICPPTASRPHFQEGYLLGHYPDIQSAEDKENYNLYEVDFAKRLLCKFHLDLANFWRRDFPIVPHAALYPERNDPLLEISDLIKDQLGPAN